MVSGSSGAINDGTEHSAYSAEIGLSNDNINQDRAAARLRRTMGHT